MQLFGYGRSDRSSKLIRGLGSKKAADFRSRRGDGHDRIPVTPHNVLFPSYKKTGVIAGLGSTAAWPIVARAQSINMKPRRAARDRLEEALARIADPNGEGARACLI